MHRPEVRQAAVADLLRGDTLAEVAERHKVGERTLGYWRAEADGRPRRSAGPQGRSGRARGGSSEQAGQPPLGLSSGQQDGSGGGQPREAFTHGDAVEAWRAEGARATRRLRDEGLTPLDRARERKVLSEATRVLALADIGATPDERYDWDRLTTEELESFAAIRRKALVSG